MNNRILSDAQRIQRLTPPDLANGKLDVVLDTDTYNEIDDQFAVVHALLSPERLNVEAIYAVPFHNDRSSGPGDGMEKSYEEILRLLARLDVEPEGLVKRGSASFLADRKTPVESEAANDLIDRAMARSAEDAPLYVMAIGAITNVVSAILTEPQIMEKIVVVWLGGQPHHWPTAWEFNLFQDPVASQLIYDCGVPLVQIPCASVASHLLTSVPEIEAHVEGYGAIGDYLAEVFKEYNDDHFAWAKEVWDISASGWLINSAWMPSHLVSAPILTDQLTYSIDNSRHLMRVVTQLRRNPIFGDLFRKLQKNE